MIFGRKGLEWLMDRLVLTMISILKIVLFMRYEMINFKPIPSDKPVLFISNHQSMWDIPPIMWYYRKNRPKFVAKKELGRFVPSVSFYLRNADHLLIDRSKSENALSKIEQFSDHLTERGYSIVVFPEGTRSKDGKVAYFKPKGIRTILEKMPDILVVPFAQHNTREIDNNGNFFKDVGLRIKVEMLPPRHLSLDHLEDQLEDLRKEISSAIGVDTEITQQ